ncbi:MAG TPA: MAPEG family protein [Gammaproteobacteria bacterium]|nr:MAPEG family protein [Gammaproteobacteria bacterium]
MRTESIFIPMLVLVFWTFVIMLFLGYKRFSAVAAKRMKFGYLKVGESEKVPDDVQLASRNFSNLFEMPVLFYTVCISAYAVHQAGDALIVLAWCYVVLRIVHSLIHVTYNHMTHRFLVYATSCLLLLVMWIVFAANLHHAAAVTISWPFH